MAVKFLTGIDLANQRGLACASPSTGTDIANKQYVDDNLAGLRWKAPVRAATTANGTLATAYANGSTIDGITLATADRILIKDQTTQTDNGIYTVNASGAPTRATDADSTAELAAATVFVLAGTVNADKAFTQTTDAVTIGTSNVVFVQFGGGTAYTADETGIHLSSTQFQLVLDSTTLSKSGSGVRIGSGANGVGLSNTSGVLAVNTGTASATGLETTGGAGGAVRIATAAVSTGLTGGGGSPITIDTSLVVQKKAFTIGDGTTTAIAVTHSLGTKDVMVQLRMVSDDSFVYADVVSTSTSVVTVTFAVAPAASAVRCVVFG